jgi:hypothetical protein
MRVRLFNTINQTITTSSVRDITAAAMPIPAFAPVVRLPPPVGASVGDDVADEAKLLLRVLVESVPDEEIGVAEVLR